MGWDGPDAGGLLCVEGDGFTTPLGGGPRVKDSPSPQPIPRMSHLLPVHPDQRILFEAEQFFGALQFIFADDDLGCLGISHVGLG